VYSSAKCNLAVNNYLVLFKEEVSRLKSNAGDFSSIIEDSLQGVVAIGTDKSLGTGFIINDNGYIVTNQHVIDNAREINVMTSDRKLFSAVLVGENKIRDVALLKIDGDFNSLELENSDSLQVGRKVIAIGNPLGLSFTVTEGIISGLKRVGPNNIKEYIQTDVSLNPGNSGGPLIDTNGFVVGMNNFKIGGDAEGLGFALESNAIKEIVNNLTNQTLIK